MRVDNNYVPSAKLKNFSKPQAKLFSQLYIDRYEPDLRDF